MLSSAIDIIGLQQIRLSTADFGCSTVAGLPESCTASFGCCGLGEVRLRWALGTQSLCPWAVRRCLSEKWKEWSVWKLTSAMGITARWCASCGAQCLPLWKGGNAFWRILTWPRRCLHMYHKMRIYVRFPQSERIFYLDTLSERFVNRSYSEWSREKPEVRRTTK